MRLIGFLMLLLIFSCEEENSISSYIRVITEPVTDISSKGVMFKAKFDPSQIDDIENHGFAWSEDDFISTSASSIINLGKPTAPEFQKFVGYELEAGNYNVRAFVTNKDNLTIYGEKVKFSSLGSEGPQLSNFTPALLNVCDTLIIEGRNFIEKSNPQVTINNKTYSGIIYEPRKNRIKVRISDLLPTKNSIEVRFNNYIARQQVNLSQKQINISLIPAQSIQPGDTIKFQFSEMPECIVPKIKIVNLDQCFACGQQVIDTNKKQVQYVLFNSCLPPELSLKVVVSDSTLYTSPKLKLESPSITTVSPSLVRVGDLVTVTGKYLESSSLFIFGQDVGLQSSTSNKVTFQIPGYIEIPPDGILSCKLYTCNGILDFSLNLALPKIVSFSPNEITSESQIVTIKGENFIPDYMNVLVCGENNNVIILEQSATEIKIQLVDILNVFCSETFIRIEFNGYATESSQYLRFYIPTPFKQLSSFPQGARIGTASFSIGNFGYVGLGSLYNAMFKDLWRYDVSKNLWERKADFPGTPRMEPASFVIGNNAYVGLGYDENLNPLSDIWKYNSQTNSWTKILDFPGSGESRSISFTIGTKGYVGRASYDLSNREFWEYNPVQNTWTQKADLLNSIETADYLPYFSSPTHGYYFADYFLNKYNPANDTWEQEVACSFTSTPGAVYVQNNFVFMFSSMFSNAFELGDQTCQGVLNKEYHTFFRDGVSSFLINGKGYFGIGSGSTLFWEIDFSSL